MASPERFVVGVSGAASRFTEIDEILIGPQLGSLTRKRDRSAEITCRNHSAYSDAYETASMITLSLSFEIYCIHFTKLLNNRKSARSPCA